MFDAFPVGDAIVKCTMFIITRIVSQAASVNDYGGSQTGEIYHKQTNFPMGPKKKIQLRKVEHTGLREIKIQHMMDFILGGRCIGPQICLVTLNSTSTSSHTLSS